jgi:hypothetical protein
VAALICLRCCLRHSHCREQTTHRDDGRKDLLGFDFMVNTLDIVWGFIKWKWRKVEAKVDCIAEFLFHAMECLTRSYC